MTDLNVSSTATPSPPSPQQRPEALQHAPQGVTEAPAKSVCLVSDNLLLARDAALQLQCFGHQVAIAARIQDIPALIAARQPDCIVVDPSSRHSALADPTCVAGIRAACPTPIPVLWLSPFNTFEMRLGAARAGVDAYLSKPVDIGLLRDRIASLANTAQRLPNRVLIVASDADRLDEFERMLSAAGMETMGLQKPLDLLRTLSQHHPELVVMDVHANTCNGADLTMLIRQDKAFLDLPVVVLARDHAADARRRALEAGADDFLLMPTPHDDLVVSVNTRIDRSRALRALIMRDGLTGLYNHRSIKEHLVREVARSKREGSPLALAVVDLDFFKKINDSYGHPVGDQVIRAISQILQQRLRHGDLIGRYGGEEFVVILPATTATAALGVLNEIREAFARVRHRADDAEFGATFSAGVAELSGTIGAVDAEALFRIADAALYKAKQAGRNQVTQAVDHDDTSLAPLR